MHTSQARGFTLVELMVVLLIAAILLCAGAPAFQPLLQARRLAQASNAFFHSVQLTRMLALRHGLRARMQPLQGNDWASGWQVRDGDTLVHQHPALAPGITISFETRGERVSFTAGGRPDPSGTWRLRGAEADPRWQVVIAWTGRVRQCRLPVGGERC